VNHEVEEVGRGTVLDNEIDCVANDYDAGESEHFSDAELWRDETWKDQDRKRNRCMHWRYELIAES
jgi:hypothetical protein